MNRCFFIGHRDAREEVFPALCEAVEHLVLAHDVKEFMVGHYGNFDRLAARAVLSVSSRHPTIRLYLLTPYHPAERPIALPVGFHGTVYPPAMESVPRRYAIVRANRYAIDCCDYLIAHVRYSPSNTADLVAYARKKHGNVTVV